MKISRETERKIDELLSRMTLEEKLLQMQQVSCEPGYEEDFARFVKLGGGSFLHVLSDQADEIRAAAAKTNHKIPPIFGIDAIHGHSLLNGAVIFPSQLAAACSYLSMVFTVASVPALSPFPPHQPGTIRLTMAPTPYL